MTDFPAGLPDRRSLRTSLGALGEKAGGTGHELFAILADLGGLQPVHEPQGPPQGARPPCAVAAALSCPLRPCEVLGRRGGDECLLTGSGGRDAGTGLPHRSAPAVRWGAGLAFGYGIAERPADGEGMDDVLAHADRALGRSRRRSHESRTLSGVRPAVESRGHGR